MEAPLAFASPHDSPGLEIRVNFGIFAGRQATAAEIDQLGEALLPEVGEVSIVAEDRHEIDEHFEASVSQVRIEVASELVEANSPGLEERMCTIAEQWAETCIADRHEDVVEL
jgi:hypothetical protein